MVDAPGLRDLCLRCAKRESQGKQIMKTYYIVLDFSRGMPSYSCYQTASDPTSAVWMAKTEAWAQGWDGEPRKHTVREA
jgi:hypothetical protein